MSDIRQLRSLFPTAAPPPARPRIPLAQWLAACLIGVVAANFMAGWSLQDIRRVLAAAEFAVPSAVDSTAPADAMPVPDDPAPAAAHSFTLCDSGPRVNCVVDGDTFWMDGEKIRVAGIDAPEIHPSHCAREEELGQRAKERLLEMLNSGAFALTSTGRDRDRYGRALREIERDGKSLGDALVGEGLARVWEGRHRSWCD